MTIAASLLALALLLCLPLCAAAAEDPQPSLRGVWKPSVYRLKNGSETAVDGQLFFSSTRWTVLFFILDEGRPRRGSAEGGSYSLKDDQLEFRHEYHFAGPGDGEGETALRMEVREAAQAVSEKCRIRIEGKRLTILFPSGNAMIFERLDS